VIAIVMLGAVVGCARSASMYAASVGIGIQDPDSALAVARTVTGGIQGAAIYPLGVLAFSLIATYREQRRALIAEQIAWETRRLRDAREWSGIRQDVIAPISGELQALGTGLDQRVIGVDEASVAVRQRAHDLWGDAQPAPTVPRVHLGTAIVLSLRHRPFATWLILAIWLPTALGTAWAVGDFPRAPLGVLLAGAIIAVVFESANAIVRRWPASWLASLLLGLVVAIVLTSPSLSLIGGMPEQGRAAYSAVNAVWLAMLVVLAAIVMGALRRGEVILSELHLAVDAASVETLAQEEERRRVVREVATTLHGTLQGRLATLRDSESAGDAVRETLAMLQTRPPIAKSTRLTRVASEALEPWRSLMAITVECADDIVAPGVAQAVGDVLEECLANAFRHGRARHVDCAVSCRGHSVEITVRDDGAGLGKSDGAPGLGSRILDRSGAWTRTYEGGGATVRVSIPSSLKVT
jgi:hypothetical protein